MVTPYTHAFFGLGLGRLCYARRRPLLFWVLAALLPVLPDLDVFLGRTYGSIWGHRGFSHTFLFAAVVGLVAAALTWPSLRGRFWVLWAFFAVATASHGILDAFTKRSFGIPFFWPLSDHRFGPWGPIVVQDIGFEVPDPRTSRSIQTELLWVWLPMVVLVGGVTVWRWIRLGRTRDGGLVPQHGLPGQRN